MGRKIKSSPLEISVDREMDERLAEILEDSREPIKAPNQYQPSRNGSDENQEEVRSNGFYWEYDGISFFDKARGKDGFEKEEVSSIAKQVRKFSEERAYALEGGRLLNDVYVLVNYQAPSRKPEQFYVHIDDMGIVWLPELVGSNRNGLRNQRVYGKTDNPGCILKVPNSEIYNPRKKKVNKSDY